MPQKINAQVIISEVYPSPTSEEKEWIELYNLGDTEINLNGYRLEDTISSASVLQTFTNQTIAPNSFYLHELASAKLNNAEDSVKLFDQNNNKIDQFDYKNAEQRQSFSRTLPLDNFSGQKVTPTPKLKNSDWLLDSSENSNNKKLVIDQNIKIESQTACETQVKLHNPNSMSFDLKNYQLKVDQNLIENTALVINTQQNYDLSVNVNQFNSMGGNIFLYDQTGQKISEASYPPCQTVVNTNQNQDNEPESENLFSNDQNIDQSQNDTNATKNDPTVLNNPSDLEDQNLALKEQIQQEKESLTQKITAYYKNKNKVDLPIIDLSIPHYKILPAKRYIDVIEIPYRPILNVIIGGLLITSSAFVAINHEEKIKFETIS